MLRCVNVVDCADVNRMCSTLITFVVIVRKERLEDRKGKLSYSAETKVTGSIKDPNRLLTDVLSRLDESSMQV